MTVPRGLGHSVDRVSDLVRRMVPFARRHLTADEQSVGVYLRGNDPLMDGLRNLIEARIKGRASLPVPSDPIDCKAFLERDRELQWFLSRLVFIHGSPTMQPVEDDGSEQPG